MTAEVTYNIRDDVNNRFLVKLTKIFKLPKGNDMESAALQISLKCSSRYPKFVEVKHMGGSITRKVKDV